MANGLLGIDKATAGRIGGGGSATKVGGSPWSGKDSSWYSSQATGQLPTAGGGGGGIFDFLKGSFTNAAGSAILSKFGAGGGNPYVTGGLMLADFLYNQYKPDTEAEKRTSLWQAEREKRLSQAQKMAMGLRKGLTQDQRIEAKQRATEAAAASRGRAGRMGVGGAAFDRGLNEQQQKLEDDLARKQRMQNVMMASQIDQGIDQQIPAIMQYYQQQGPPAIEGLLGDLQDLMAHDPQVNELTKTLAKLGGKEGLASLIEKLAAGVKTDFGIQDYTPPKPNTTSITEDPRFKDLINRIFSDALNPEPVVGPTPKGATPNRSWKDPYRDRFRREALGTAGL